MPALPATGVAAFAARRGVALAADRHALGRLIRHHLGVGHGPLFLGRNHFAHHAAAGTLLRLIGADVNRHFTRLRYRFAHAATALTLLRLIRADVDGHFTGLRHRLAHLADALTLFRL